MNGFQMIQTMYDTIIQQVSQFYNVMDGVQTRKQMRTDHDDGLFPQLKKKCMRMS